MSKITICHYSSNTTIERLYQRNLINATQGNSQNSRKKQASKDNTDTFANNIIQKKKQSCLTRHCLPFEIRKEIYWVYLQLLLSWRWCFQILACEQQLDRWLCWRRMLRTRLRPADPLAGLRTNLNQDFWDSKQICLKFQTWCVKSNWTGEIVLDTKLFAEAPSFFFFQTRCFLLLNLQTRRFLFKNSSNQMFF